MRAVAILLLLVGCASPSPEAAASATPSLGTSTPEAQPSSTSSTHTLYGQVPHSALLCPAHEHLGIAEVVVRDENDEIIGAGRVGKPGGVERNHFEIAGLPEAEFYQIEVGDLLSETYARAELEADDWRVTIIEPCPS